MHPRAHSWKQVGTPGRVAAPSPLASLLLLEKGNHNPDALPQTLAPPGKDKGSFGHEGQGSLPCDQLSSALWGLLPIHQPRPPGPESPPPFTPTPPSEDGLVDRATGATAPAAAVTTHLPSGFTGGADASPKAWLHPVHS